MISYGFYGLKEPTQPLAPHWQAIDDAPWDLGGYPITIFRSIPPKHRPDRGLQQGTGMEAALPAADHASGPELECVWPDHRQQACSLSELSWGELLLHLATPIQSKRVPENATLKKERKEERAAQLVGKGQISRAYTALTSSLSPEVY